VYCPGCRRSSQVVLWPAADREPDRGVRAMVAAAGEAVCFACADKAATGVCAGCGCFTCPACEVSWIGESLCLSCLHDRRERKESPEFRARARLHDNVALGLLVLPILLVPFYGLVFSALASPVALFLVIRHWNAPRGLPPRGRARLVMAGVLAVVLLAATLGGVGAGIYGLFRLAGSAEVGAESGAAAAGESEP
jgi:hypothetical protein